MPKKISEATHVFTKEIDTESIEEKSYRLSTQSLSFYEQKGKWVMTDNLEGTIVDEVENVEGKAFKTREYW